MWDLTSGHQSLSGRCVWAGYCIWIGYAALYKIHIVIDNLIFRGLSSLLICFLFLSVNILAYKGIVRSGSWLEESQHKSYRLIYPWIILYFLANCGIIPIGKSFVLKTNNIIINIIDIFQSCGLSISGMRGLLDVMKIYRSSGANKTLCTSGHL